MGSFNMTCVASQQTIAPGDACRVLPILQQSTYDSMKVTRGDREEEVSGPSHSTCYYEAFWTPIGGTIAARYDDYGNVNLEMDDVSRTNLLGLFRHLLQYGWTTTQGENEYHDHPFDLAGFLANKAPRLGQVLKEESTEALDTLDNELNACWNYVWTVADKFRLFVSNYKGQPRALGFALVHAEAYDYLVDYSSQGTGWDGKSRDPRSVLTGFFNEGMEPIGDPTEMTDEKEQLFASFALGSTLRENISRCDGVGKSLGATTMGVLNDACKDFLQGRITQDELMDALMPIMRDRYFLAGMDVLNLRLSPVVSSGQDYSNEIGTAYAKFIAAVNPRVNRARVLEMYGEFEAFTMMVPSDEAMVRLISNMPEWDAAMGAVRSSPLAEGNGLFMQFECTLDLDTLKECIEENMSDIEGVELMLQTLQSDEAGK